MDRLFDQMAVPDSERALWHATISTLAGTNALREKLPAAPVFRTGPDPDLEWEKLAETILADRHLRPQRFDRAFTEPALGALLEAVTATTNYRIAQMNEMEKADAAQARSHGSVRFGRSDEGRPLIEAAQRRVGDLQRRYDELPDPMVASRELRRHDKLAARQAQLDLQRLATQQAQEKRRLEELAAKRERRRQAER